MLAFTYDEVGRNVANSTSFGREDGRKNADGTYKYPTFLSYVTQEPPRILWGRTTYGEDGPAIWITPRGVAPFREDVAAGITPGGVVFHEGVHVYLSAVGLSSHVNTVNELGIDLVAQKQGIDDNQRASDSLQAWIERGCRNVTKKVVTKGR